MGEQHRHAPWEDESPFRAGPLKWATDSSFWRSIAMAVISTAIIGAFATYFLAIAIYSKYGPSWGVISVNFFYFLLILASGATITSLYAYKADLRKKRLRKRHVGAILPILSGIATLWLVWVLAQLAVANLVNTIEFKPAPLDGILPSLMSGQQSAEDAPFDPTSTRSP